MPDKWRQLESGARGLVHALTAVRTELREIGVRTEPEPPRLQLVSEPLEPLFNVLELFPTLVGYLKGRRPSGSVFEIESEADVQDLLYVALKPAFPEMVYEEPTKKGAAGYSIGDFSIESLKLILEVKYVVSREDVKAKAREISEDIWKYADQTDCENVIFFVYDPRTLIPDRVNFAASFRRWRVSSGRAAAIFRSSQWSNPNGIRRETCGMPDTSVTGATGQ